MVDYFILATFYGVMSTIVVHATILAKFPISVGFKAVLYSVLFSLFVTIAIFPLAFYHNLMDTIKRRPISAVAMTGILMLHTAYYPNKPFTQEDLPNLRKIRAELKGNMFQEAIQLMIDKLTK